MKSSKSKALKTKKAALSNGRGKILVMDDDSLVRSVIRDMLTESGYDARITRNGDEAIEKFKAAKALGRPFDVVILDLNVPFGMEGTGAIEKLLDIDSEVKAILLTADIAHPMVAHYEECGFKAALIKPFTRGELMQALKWIIAG